VTFLVPAGGRARIQGRSVQPGDVVVFFEGDEFHYRSSGDAQLLSVSVERATLDAHARAYLGRGIGELRLQGRLGGLRADLEALRELCRHPDREDLAVALVMALLGGFEKPPAMEATGRGRALAMKAEAWLRQNLSEPPTVAHLCDALGASQRTLHEAFRQNLDDTPKSYLKTLRLNAARQDLLEGRAGRRVTDVALDWGFVHFGWFSQDYRRHFGETPSETLQLARARFGRVRRA
jgi:AraC-like DNA-binding protein